MRIGKWKKRRGAINVGALAALSLTLLALAVAAVVQATPAREATSVTRPGYWYAREVNNSAFHSLQITGLTYAPEREEFYAVLAPDGPDLQLAAFSSQFELLSTWRVPAAQLTAPMPLYNAADGRLYLLDGGRDCCGLYSLQPRQNTVRDEGYVALDAHPDAAAFDEQGNLLIQSRHAQTGTVSARAYQLMPGSEAALAADLPEFPTYELTFTGANLHDVSLVTVRELQLQATGATGHGVANVRQLARSLRQNLTGLNATTAPTLDSTDDAQALSLFVVGPESMIEIAYQEPPVLEPLDLVTATLLSRTNTWQWSPPSPDPAGITYLPGSNQLLISDSEVNEEGWWQDANLFQTSLTGSLQATDSTTEFSREPTGVSVNPSNGHIFITDDDQHQFYTLNGLPGSGNLIHTVNTEAVGSSDPEGIAFDPVSGHVFIVDGVDSEVYRFTPNGTFVGQFDVGSMGVGDPEGIAYDELSDNLLVLDSSDGQVVEVTKTGNWVRDIALSAPDLDKPAGLVYGPSASGATVRTLYVVDRQLDNSDDDEENDGLLFEFQVPVDEHETPTPTPSGTATDAPPPTATSTATETNTPPPTATDAPPASATPVTPTPVTPTNTPAPSATATPSNTPVPSVSPTGPPPTATNTPAGPTATPEILPTDTPTVTPQPSPTATPQGQPTPTVAPGARYRNYFPVLSFQRFDQLGEQNDNCASSYPLLTNSSYQFLAEDRDDWYRFTITEQADITIRLANFAPLLGQIAVYHGETCGTATFLANNGNNSAEKVLALGQQPPGDFYLYVSNDGPINTGSLYSLIVQTR